MRVAFTLLGGSQWTGGHNYLLNLFRVLRVNPAADVAPVLFAGDDVGLEQLAPFRQVVGDSVVRTPALRASAFGANLAAACVTGSAAAIARVLRSERIDVAFEAAEFFGWRFPVPALAWIPDFQHRHLPHMFSRRQWLRREIGHRVQVAAGRRVMLSSVDARSDCERFHPATRGRTEVVHFAVQVPCAGDCDRSAAMHRAGLPARFMFMPNQFWKHKNHAVVIDAVAQLKRSGVRVVVGACGNPHDARHADYFRGLRARVEEQGVADEFRFLGMLPYEDVVALTAAAQAVINPSLFEGWSTTVEEAKSVGTPLVLSDIAVHREQAAGQASFFDPGSPAAAAQAILGAWQRDDQPDLEERIRLATNVTAARVQEFAFAFARAVVNAASGSR